MTINQKNTGESLHIGDSDRYLEKKEKSGRNKREYFSEIFNFACVLRGEVKYLEEIKEYIVQEYVNKGVIKLIRPTYDKKEIYIATDDLWKEYQKLKEKDERLIGAGFI